MTERMQAETHDRSRTATADAAVGVAPVVARDPATARRAPTVIAFPRSGTSYTDCFYDHVASSGAEVIDGIYSGRWLLARLSQMDAVHLHWPSFHYYQPGGGLANWVRLLRFGLLMAALRLCGKKIVWTAHNLYPHDGGRGERIHRAGRLVLRLLANRVLVHGRAARDEVVRELGIAPRKAVTIDHGHFIGYYADQCTRAEARRALGLPDVAKVFAFVGLCKPYKNLERLIPTFQSLEGEPHLVIAGKFQSSGYRARIDELIAKRPERIQLHPRFVADDELQTFVKAADCMVLPYNEILTSGAVMLGLSFGIPVIAPRLGSLPEVVAHDSGLLYDPADADALRRCMAEFDPAQFDAERVLAQARRFSWERSAAAFLDALKS